MGLLFSARCTSSARLDGKTAVVMGSNTGIGKYTAKDFFLRGARIIMACRNLEKAEQAAKDIKEECKYQENVGEIIIIHLDLSSLKSVKKCAHHLLNTEKRIDLLINNAGIMMCLESRTEDGFEMQFGTNHLGHFLLTLLLLPRICQSTPARIVNVSSLLYLGTTMNFSDLNWEKRPYSRLGAYRQSKLANVLFTRELARKLKENNIEGVNVYSLHPGVIKTELSKHILQRLPWVASWLWNNVAAWFIKTPEQGAQTAIYCAVDEKCGNETGLYYVECAAIGLFETAKNEKVEKLLWEISLNLVGIEKKYDPFKCNV